MDLLKSYLTPGRPKIQLCHQRKSNFYKKQVASMESDDEWIEVEIDEKWLKRADFLQKPRN